MTKDFSNIYYNEKRKRFGELLNREQRALKEVLVNGCAIEFAWPSTNWMLWRQSYLVEDAIYRIAPNSLELAMSVIQPPKFTHPNDAPAGHEYMTRHGFKVVICEVVKTKKGKEKIRGVIKLDNGKWTEVAPWRADGAWQRRRIEGMRLIDKPAGTKYRGES